MCVILDFTIQSIAKERITPDSPNYPIVTLEKYEEPSSVVGVGGDVMYSTYGCVLRAEFVRQSIKPGSEHNPTRDLYFKVLPRGCADVAGILLGYPALDAAPYGLGLQPTESTHFFKEVGINMPRS